MTRKHLEELARLIGGLRPDLSPVRYEQLLADLSALCAKVNPAFDEQRFREAAAAVSWRKAFKAEPKGEKA